MNQPLGHAVGNALEVKECVEILRGDAHEKARPVLDLSVELAARMVGISGVEPSLEAARARVTQALASGAGLELLPPQRRGAGRRPARVRRSRAPLGLDARGGQGRIPAPGLRRRRGRGGGRSRRRRRSAAGARAWRTRSTPRSASSRRRASATKSAKGDVLGLLYCRDAAGGEEAAARIQAAYTVSSESPVRVPRLIKEVITP